MTCHFENALSIEEFSATPRIHNLDYGDAVRVKSAGPVGKKETLLGLGPDCVAICVPMELLKLKVTPVVALLMVNDVGSVSMAPILETELALFTAGLPGAAKKPVFASK